MPVAALAAPGVLDELGDELGDVLPDYLRLLLRWNVRLFVRYGVALEAHQQNLALLFRDGRMRLLVKDNDGLLASPHGCGRPGSRCRTSPTSACSTTTRTPWPTSSSRSRCTWPPPPWPSAPCRPPGLPRCCATRWPPHSTSTATTPWPGSCAPGRSTRPGSPASP
ncbi:IucA/IucC family C-terminal-domain containing protein [Nonomuraea antimicrobica]